MSEQVGLRDYLASQAVPALMRIAFDEHRRGADDYPGLCHWDERAFNSCSDQSDSWATYVAKSAYVIADAMLVERQKEHR